MSVNDLVEESKKFLELRDKASVGPWRAVGTSLWSNHCIAVGISNSDNAKLIEAAIPMADHIERLTDLVLWQETLIADIQRVRMNETKQHDDLVSRSEWLQSECTRMAVECMEYRMNFEAAAKLAVENESAFKVWRRRCQESEAKLAALEEAEPVMYQYDWFDYRTGEYDESWNVVEPRNHMLTIEDRVSELTSYTRLDDTTKPMYRVRPLVALPIMNDPS